MTVLARNGPIVVAFESPAAGRNLSRSLTNLGWKVALFGDPQGEEAATEMLFALGGARDPLGHMSLSQQLSLAFESLTAVVVCLDETTAESARDHIVCARVWFPLLSRGETSAYVIASWGDEPVHTQEHLANSAHQIRMIAAVGQYRVNVVHVVLDPELRGATEGWDNWAEGLLELCHQPWQR